MTEWEGAGTIIGGIVTMVTGAIFWARNNKTADTKARADRAANYADEAAHQGQATEIRELRQRVSALDAAFVAQSARLALLEAIAIGTGIHMENLVLCPMCTKKNKDILEAMAASLAKAKKEHEEHEKEHTHEPK